MGPAVLQLLLRAGVTPGTDARTSLDRLLMLVRIMMLVPATSALVMSAPAALLELVGKTRSDYFWCRMGATPLAVTAIAIPDNISSLRFRLLLVVKGNAAMPMPSTFHHAVAETNFYENQ